VVPKDKDESLDKIKAALHIYLDTPGFDNFNTQIEINSDLAVMQWQANIMHLKSQLILANSILQLKDATIQSLQLSNYQYQLLLNEKGQQKESDKEEEVIKGIVSVKKYEGKGFSINLAEILRRLKRTFK
jgi:transcriptional regulator of aromatic amino acid metabolism